MLLFVYMAKTKTCFFRFYLSWVHPLSLVTGEVHVVRKLKSMYMEVDGCCVYAGEHKKLVADKFSCCVAATIFLDLFYNLLLPCYIL